jgi:predicted dehydrogenase
MASAQACADAGCDLLIEKPLAASLDGVDHLERTIAARKLRAAVAYQLRFHPAIVRMRELVCRGSLGRLVSVQAEYGQHLSAWRPTRDYRDTYTARAALGGGILLDASHEIDYVRWIGGEMQGVYAFASRLSDLDMDAEDTAALVVRFASGAIAEIHLDCVRRGYSRTCTLIGTEATVRWDVKEGLRITSADGTTRAEPIVPEPNLPYVDELAAFLHGAENAPLATVHDARRVLEIVLAARESAARRQEVPL